jgi:hypothetical protein
VIDISMQHLDQQKPSAITNNAHREVGLIVKEHSREVLPG